MPSRAAALLPVLEASAVPDGQHPVDPSFQKSRLPWDMFALPQLSATPGTGSRTKCL